jgi:hypothetical protein
MPGIEDVQPKQISTLGQPIVAPIESVVTPASTLPVLDVINRQREAAVQAVDYGFNAPVVAAQRKVALAQAPLAVAQAQKGLQTLNTGDLVQRHLAYSTPIIGPDGKPDYSAMAESGMNYRRAEMMLQYAQSGLTALPPIETVDPKSGLPVKVYKNVFGENPYDEKVQDRYHKLRDAASQTLMGKPQINSSWHPSDLIKQAPPEEGAAGIPHSSHQVSVTPPNTDVSGVVLPAAPVTAVDVAPEIIQPTVALPPTNQVLTPDVVAPLRAMVGVPAAPARQVFDLANLDAYRNAQVAPQPVVAPNEVATASSPAVAAPYTPGAAAPVTVSTPNHTITVQPKPAPAPAPALAQLPEGMVQTSMGPGYPTGNLRAMADKLVEDARKTDYIAGWSKVKDVVNEFNSVKQSYEGVKDKSITSQKDVALANTLIRLQNPAGTGRGFGELHVENLEKDAPRIEQLLHIKGLVLKEHAFTPETRKRLIEEGNRLVNSIEAPARSELTRIASRIQDIGRPLSDHLNGDEMSLLGQGSAPATATGVSGPVRVLNDGTRVRIKQ